MNEKINFTDEEAEAIYKLVKEYEKNFSDSDEEYYDDYYDNYEEPIEKKIIKSILKKASEMLSEKQRIEIDKDFLRKKYPPFTQE